MKITNREVIQSYLITAARYDFSVYEKRILYRLVEMCQGQLEGKKLNAGFQMNKTLFGDHMITIPISSFLADDHDENYTRVKSALTSLRNKTIEYEDSKIWKLIGIIEKPKFEKRGYAHFEIQPEIYDAILNFSKGYRRYELKTAMSFETVYAMRFYELFSEKKEPITYSINDLKIMFQLQDKYKLTTDFLRYVVDTAKDELDKKSPYSFTYKKECRGKKVVALKFFIHETTNIDGDLVETKLQKQVSIGFDLDKIIIDYLKQNYMFDTDEIKHNRTVFVEASKKLDIMSIMASKKRYCEGRKNPKGTLMSILKKELAKSVEQTTVATNDEKIGNIQNMAATLAKKLAVK